MEVSIARAQTQIRNDNLMSAGGDRKDGFDAAARRLRDAYRSAPIAPLRDYFSPNDIDAAYAVQSINTAAWISEGRRVVGRKIGLTSASVQQQLGVDQPDFGVLFADMLVPNRGILHADRVLQAKVEGEVAFVMGRDVDNPSAKWLDMLTAIAYALPAVEIVDSRIANWKISIADTVADNASSAFFVLGTEPRLLAGLDLLSCGMVLTMNGEIASVGAGAACLGHPLHAAAWLARTLAVRGDPLRAGDVVMSGALGPMALLAPGAHVCVTVGGLGMVEFYFRESASGADK
jgi:2-keto-4-pentenoate hydratase